MGVEAPRLHRGAGTRPRAALVPPRNRPADRGRAHGRAGLVTPRLLVPQPSHLERPAAALALLTGLATIVALVAVATISVVEQFAELRAAVSQAVDDIAGQLQDEPIELPGARTDELESSLRDAWREASGYAAAGVQTGAGIVAGVVLAVAMLYFVLRDGAALWSAILRTVGPEARPVIDRAGRRAWDVLAGFVRGTAMVATIDAVLIGTGLGLLDVPLAFALAVLVFMSSFIPYVGAFVSGLVAVLVAFADGGWQLAPVSHAPARVYVRSGRGTRFARRLGDARGVRRGRAARRRRHERPLPRRLRAQDARLIVR